MESNHEIGYAVDIDNYDEVFDSLPFDAELSEDRLDLYRQCNFSAKMVHRDMFIQGIMDYE